MPTTRTRYVDPASAGGDGTTTALSGANAAYASLQAAFTAEAGDITAATGSDEIVHFICDGLNGTALDSVRFNDAGMGWITAATEYVKVTVAAGNEHGGVWDESVYHIIGSDSFLITDGGLAHVEFHGIQFGYDGSTSSSREVVDLDEASRKITAYFIDCIFCVKGGGTGGRYGFYNSSNDVHAAYLINCQFVLHSSYSGTATTLTGCYLQVGEIWAYNCQAVGGWEKGFDVNSGTFIAKNCLADGCVTADFEGSFDGASDYNASSDGTAPGTNSQTGQTFTFESGSDNWRLASSDSGAKDLGTDLSSDTDYPFSTDCVGTSRPVGSNWDIGPIEAAAGGGGSVGLPPEALGLNPIQELH